MSHSWRRCSGQRCCSFGRCSADGPRSSGSLPPSAPHRWAAGSSACVPGWHADPLPWWTAVSAVTVALASAAILVAAWPRGALREAEKFLVWTIAAQALFVAVLWLTSDRYGLVFVPLTAALVLARRPPLRTGPAVACIAVFAVIALAGGHHPPHPNPAGWSAGADLPSGGG